MSPVFYVQFSLKILPIPEFPMPKEREEEIQQKSN
jgi:hypothetical protein